jgi:hypothetical protein
MVPLNFFTRDQLTEYQELKAIEKKIDEFGAKNGSRILELTLKSRRSDEETAALEWLKHN